jgi:hypothetical protein
LKILLLFVCFLVPDDDVHPFLHIPLALVLSHQHTHTLSITGLFLCFVFNTFPVGTIAVLHLLQCNGYFLPHTGVSGLAVSDTLLF